MTTYQDDLHLSTRSLLKGALNVLTSQSPDATSNAIVSLQYRVMNASQRKLTRSDLLHELTCLASESVQLAMKEYDNAVSYIPPTNEANHIL